MLEDSYLTPSFLTVPNDTGDPFCVILRINSASFTQDGIYSSTGPAMILQTNRREFTRFVRDLKREYKAVPKRKARSCTRA
jgi:hypothetical protein